MAKDVECHGEQSSCASLSSADKATFHTHRSSSSAARDAGSRRYSRNCGLAASTHPSPLTTLRRRALRWGAQRSLPRLGPALRWNSAALAAASQHRGAVQKRDEFKALLDLLKSAGPLDTVVEIGTAQGGTFFAWCKLGSRTATIVSIDLPGGEFGGGYGEDGIRRMRSYARHRQETHFLQLDSHAPETKQELEKVLNGRKIDFLMVDGDHSYEGVLADYEMYSPLVRHGGLIAFHDIVFHDHVPACQVDRFWNEVRAQFESWEFTKPEEDDRGYGVWGGIGVLRVG